MAFRSPENVSRYEALYFDLQTPIVIPANGAFQRKTGYRFVADNTGEVSPFDWWNAKFLIDFKIQKKAGGNVANNDKNGVVNDAASMIKDLQFKVNGTVIYDGKDVNQSVNIKHLLEYSSKYASTIGSNELYYLDQSRVADPAANKGFAARKTVLGASTMLNVIIPLNSYSFMESLREKLIPNMKCELEVRLEEDANFTWDDADPTRYVIHKFQLWVPKITFTPNGVNNYKSKFLSPMKWTYMMENVFQSTARKESTGSFDISSGVKNPRHVFVWFNKTEKMHNPKSNIFHFDTFILNQDVSGTDTIRTLESSQLEMGNGIFYPEREYVPSKELARIYHDVLCYNYSCFDTTIGSQLTRHNYSLIFPFLYFDLRYQKIDTKNNTNKLKFSYRFSGPTDDNYNVFALVLFEQEVELYDSTGKILIRNL